MSYVRVKWIKGNPYLYEQKSYRVGRQVRTRHIRYIGKYGFSTTTGGFATGKIRRTFDLPPQTKEELEKQLRTLNYGKTHLYELAILRQYMYGQRYKINLKVSRTGSRYVSGYFKTTLDVLGNQVFSPEMGLKPDSDPFTWMHELGHSLETQDKLIDEEIGLLRHDFILEVLNQYGSTKTLEDMELFIKKYGKLIDMRLTMQVGHSIPPRWPQLLEEISLIRQGRLYRDDAHRALVEQGTEKPLSETYLQQKFDRWADIGYRTNPREVYADAVAGLILSPKTAFECFGKDGQRFLTKVWITTVKHLENEYRISLNRT